MVDIESTRIRIEALVGLLIGVSYGHEVFSVVADAIDAASAAATLGAMQFDAPTDLRMVLPALPGSLMLSDRQVQAILNNRLHRFTNRERQECLDELRSLVDSTTGARK